LLGNPQSWPLLELKIARCIAAFGMKVPPAIAWFVLVSAVRAAAATAMVLTIGNSSADDSACFLERVAELQDADFEIVCANIDRVRL